MPATQRLFAAGYGGKIFSLAFDPTSSSSSTPSLSVTSSTPAGSAPTWVEQHPSLPILYAIDEFHPKDGRVSRFSIDTESGALEYQETTSSGGEGPAHLAFDHSGNGKNLFVANYGGGTAARIALNEDGMFQHQSLDKADQSFQFTGKGPQSDRQEAPHPHGAFVTPSGKHLLITDLGTDLLRVFSISPSDSSLTELAPLPTTSGGGPRHLLFSQDSTKLYLVNELANSLSIYAFSESTSASSTPEIKLLQTTSVLPASQKEHHSTPGWTAAELSFSPCGRKMIVSNRSPGPGLEGPMDKLVVFTLDGEGLVKDGEEGVKEVDSGGRGLRHFELSRDGKWLAVGAEKTNEVVVFGLEGDEMTEVARVGGVDQPTVVRWMV